MLVSAHRQETDAESTYGSIHNYYEKLVIEQILRCSDEASADANFLADVACVALNSLPPRYVRYDVDMTFYLSQSEQEEMADKVALTVNQAIDYVTSRKGSERQPANSLSKK